MLQIKLILNSTRDGEPNNGPPLSEGALSFFCKVQSSLSRDEIISLYERVGTITKCLLHFDVEDDASPLQPLAARLCDPDTNASSFPSQFIDPSLITLDKGPRDHPKTTSFTSPDLDRPHLPTQSGARELLSEPSSSPFDEGVRGHCTSGACNKDKPPPFENANVIPTTHGSVGHDENDFDSVFREIDEMDASGHSLNVRPGYRGCTTDPESSTCPPGGETGEEIARVDSDGDDPMTSQPRTQISDSNRDERICHDISVGNIQERSHEMATAGSEEYSHRASPDNTTCENQEQSAEASVVTPGPGTAISYSTPDSKTPNTPMPASKRVKRFEEVTSGRSFLPSPSQTPGPASGSADRTPNSCESGRLSALQPTVEDAPDGTELGDTGNEFPDDDGFEDSEIQSVLKEAHKFLQATSSTPEMTFEAPEGAIKASSRNIDVTPENGLDPTRGSPSNDDYSNSRKRKLDVASLEEHAGSTPSTMSSLSDALSDDAGSESAASSSPPAEEDEDENDMDSQDLPRSESRQASTVSEQSTEELDEIMAYEPDIPGSVFSKLTGQQAGEVRRIGDHLLLRNLACFLGTYSRAWKAAGFWSASSWTTTQPSSIVLRPNRAGLMTYLVGLHNDNAIHDVKTWY
ncbi:hypothetical protein PMG11_04295 [Penicillium brasilianum]|uniref:Uncharacterized protein n=1 Tax=Penicillium brasilianum TaxID=104259 RepID=A0A0F7VJ02_PENBI|nr:hypothetical protein PMG11_04295 [Penicillium brasilianum]